MAKKCVKTRVKKWVAALKSGEYKQKSCSLRNRGSYCCLGVACDLYINSSVGKKNKAHWALDDNGLWEFVSIKGQENSYLPAEVSEYLGIKGKNPLLGKSSATYLNDTNEYTFPQIAEAIKKTYGV